MIDDYEYEQETAELLGLFNEARDAMESDRPSAPYSEKIAEYLHTLTCRTKGQVIIDLLTLHGQMDSIILALKTREMDR